MATASSPPASLSLWPFSLGEEETLPADLRSCAICFFHERYCESWTPTFSHASLISHPDAIHESILSIMRTFCPSVNARLVPLRGPFTGRFGKLDTSMVECVPRAFVAAASAFFAAMVFLNVIIALRLASGECAFFLISSVMPAMVTPYVFSLAIHRLICPVVLRVNVAMCLAVRQS